MKKRNMSRPNFVTEQDIARWGANIDQDPMIPSEFAGISIMREVLYAGLWLAEQLDQLGCHPLLITRVQYTAGQLSYGRDPWEVAQEVLKAYKENDLVFEIDYNEDRK
jgi:hypothetical protein